MTLRLSRRSVVAGAGSLLFAPRLSWGAGWPERPITLVHGFGPGGNSDGMTRVAAEGLTARLGQQVVVDPRPGAGGVTAADQIARAAPDGYSLILFTGAHAACAAIYKKVPYDTINDFSYISFVATGTPFTIATYPSHPVSTPAQFIEYAKNAKVPPTYATSGIGTTLHLAMELLASKANIKLQHIPYKQNSQSMVDLLSKRIDFVINGPQSVFPQIAAKEIKGVAVTSTNRYADMPDVQAIAEVLPGYEVITYYGIAGPKNMPADVVARIGSELAVIMKQQVNIDRVKGLGSEAASSSPQAFRDQVAKDVKNWTEVVKAANIEQI